jgi:hypothetical protein
MRFLLGAMFGLWKSIGTALTKAFFREVPRPMPNQLTHQTQQLPEIPPTSPLEDYGDARVAQFYRQMANSQRVGNIAAAAYRETTQHDLDIVKEADEMAHGILNGRFGNNKAPQSQPTSRPSSANWGEDGMDLRVKSPTVHNHYYPQPSPPVAQTVLSTLGKILLGLLVAGLTAAAIASPFIYNKLFNKPAPALKLPAQPKWGLDLLDGDSPGATK